MSKRRLSWDPERVLVLVTVQDHDSVSKLTRAYVFQSVVMQSDRFCLQTALAPVLPRRPFWLDDGCLLQNDSARWRRNKLKPPRCCHSQSADLYAADAHSKLLSPSLSMSWAGRLLLQWFLQVAIIKKSCQQLAWQKAATYGNLRSGWVCDVCE